MRCLFICMVLTLTSVFCLGKEITGRVVDETGEPLAFANVMLMWDTTFIVGEVTDSAGMFLIKDEHNVADTLKVSMIGYKELSISISGNGDFKTLTMLPSSVALSEVIVNGMRPTTTIKGDSFVTMVENTLLSTLGSANDVLKNVPMLTGDNGRYQVFGRGDATIYINGRLLRNPADVGRLASSDVKEVQVISNPGARYGGDVKAVVKIITKKPKGEGFSLGAYSDNIYNRDFRTENQLDFKYRSGGLEIFAIGYFSKGKNPHSEYLMMDTYRQSIVSVNSRIDISSIITDIYGRIGFNYQPNQNHSIGAYYRNESDKNSSIGNYQNDIYENGLPIESTISNQRGRSRTFPSHGANVYYSGIMDKISINADFDYLSGKEKDHSIHQEENKTSADRNVTTTNILRNRLFAEKVILGYNLPYGEVLIGEEYTNSSINNEFMNDEAIIMNENNKIKESNIGIFTQIRQTYKHLSISAGIRYEHVCKQFHNDLGMTNRERKKYNNFFPSAAISLSPGNAKFSISYSGHTVRPTYANLNGNYSYVSSVLYTRGNPYLVSAARHDFSFMASWRFVTFSANYSRTKDAIMQIYEPYEGDDRVSVLTVANMPLHKTLSLMAGVSPKFGSFSPSLYFGMQKQWFKIDYNDISKNMGTPSFSIQLNNTLTLPGEWYVNALFWWRSRGDWKNWAYTHTQSRLNLRVYKMFMNRSLAVYLGINDIFNGMVYHADLFNENVRMQSNVNNYGRNVELTIRYSLNPSNNRYKGNGAGASEKSRF